MGGRGLISVVLAVMLLVGCGSTPPPTAPQSAIQWSRTGGIAGVSEVLTVKPDGAAEASTRTAKTAFSLTQAERKNLNAAFSAADPENQESPKTKTQGADGMDYRIAYDGHEVVWGSFTDDPTPELQALWSLLADLYERHAPR